MQGRREADNNRGDRPSVLTETGTSSHQVPPDVLVLSGWGRVRSPSKCPIGSLMALDLVSDWPSQVHYWTGTEKYISHCSLMRSSEDALGQCNSSHWINLLLNFLIINLLKHLSFHFVYEFFICCSTSCLIKFMSLATLLLASFSVWSGSQTSSQRCCIRSVSSSYFLFMIVYSMLKSTLSITVPL